LTRRRRIRAVIDHPQAGGTSARAAGQKQRKSLPFGQRDILVRHDDRGNVDVLARQEDPEMANTGGSREILCRGAVGEIVGYRRKVDLVDRVNVDSASVIQRVDEPDLRQRWQVGRGHVVFAATAENRGADTQHYETR